MTGVVPSGAGWLCSQHRRRIARLCGGGRLFGAGIDAQDFAAFAFRPDGEGTAADFAVGGEFLARHQSVEADFTILAAVRTLDSCGFFHTLSAFHGNHQPKQSNCPSEHEV
jgi:hypothetical protein